MTDLGYLIWFLATGAMTIIVLTVGTLAAAGMLPAREARRIPRSEGSALDAVHRPRSTPAGDREERAASPLRREFP